MQVQKPLPLVYLRSGGIRVPLGLISMVWLVIKIQVFYHQRTALLRYLMLVHLYLLKLLLTFTAGVKTLRWLASSGLMVRTVSLNAKAATSTMYSLTSTTHVILI